MIDDLSYFFIFFAGFMSWTIALGVILENEKQTYHYMFAGLMFCLGSLQILDGLLVAGKLIEYSALIFWYLPFMALLGPLFFFSFKSANNDSFRFRPIDYLHFAYGILIIPLLIPLTALDSSTKMSFIMLASDEPLFRLYSGLLAAVILNIVGYQIYFIRECFFMLNLKLIREKKVSPYLITIMLINFPLEIIFFGSMIALSMIGHPRLLFFSVIQSLTALSFLLTLVIFIMEKKNINFFKILHIQIENRRYESSKVKNLDVLSLLSRIKSLMEDEKIFCDEDLSVNGLAMELAIEPYQLSQVINENFNKNFKNFINEYRIEEAKKILLSERDRTIISVAYAVGFNSTTVFYEWFNRITGVSPKKFRSQSKSQKPADVPLKAVISN
jgi:AraC-like DNA-binding protein